MEEVFIMDHPLIQHKISRLRDETTGTNEFRKLVEEIGMLMGYEALRDLKMEKITVKTPIEECGSACHCRKETGDRADPACGAWHGERYAGTGTVCEGGTYRALPRS